MVRLLPLKFHLHDNPIGLAAGFDKNAELIEYLPYFGFGHVEVGTVTPKPQGGNERPRLFRNPEKQTLFNRMGFNNLGAGIISERVRRARRHIPDGFIIGVNLGKNKITPDTDAASDYAKVAKAFIDCADYFVINVSSPNTPGLRALQTPEALVPIFAAVHAETTQSRKKIPIYVKLAPEIQGESLKLIVNALEKAGADGFVLTNTEAGVYIYREKELPGGWSGRNLTEVSRDRLIEVRQMTTLPLISVGGIMSEEEALKRIQSGANRVQIYTGWIYNGPFFAKRILKKLLKN